MALAPQADWVVKRATLAWTERDAILYALGLGLGAEPLDPSALAYVYERALRPLPTLLTALARTMMPTVGELGGDHGQTVHVVQQAVFHRPIAARGTVAITGSVAGISDRGAGRGALLHTRAELRDERGPLATLESIVLARGDGTAAGAEPPRSPVRKIPDRPSDRTVLIAVAPDQAAIYRLSGDLNPLHIDPDAARAAGFPRPILHGLCTYGLACRAVVEHCAGGDPDRVREHRARFTAPLYPGETLRAELWLEPDAVLFEAWANERGVKVLGDGLTRLGDAAAA